MMSDNNLVNKPVSQWTEDERKALIAEMEQLAAEGRLTNKQQLTLVEVMCESQVTPSILPVLHLKRPVTQEDIAHFTDFEKSHLDWYIANALRHVVKDTRDTFIAKFSEVTTQQLKDSIHTHEKVTILECLKTFVKKGLRLPTINELYAEVKFMTETAIRKHLPNEDYSKGCFELMSEAVLSTLFYASTTYYNDGSYNVKAARLYLEATGAINGPKVKTINNNTHNNFLQINNTILSQQAIENLDPAKRLMIEGIINGDVPKFQEAQTIELPIKKKSNAKTKNR